MRWLRVDCFLLVIQFTVAVYLTDLVNKPLNRLVSYYKQDVEQRHKNWLFNPKVAKNVILVLVEGLDSHTMSVARQIMEAQTTAINNYMSALDFFISGQLKPSSRDFIVADPAAAVSGIFNGLPEYNGQIGWVEQEAATCLQYDKSKRLLKNLFKVMSEAGKQTALFTTSRLTSPGVAGTFAATPDMQIESDIHLTESGCTDGKFKDIAAQLIKDNRELNMIIGGGRQYFMKSGSKDQMSTNSVYPWRNDFDLRTYWAMDKVLRKKAHKDAVGTQTVKDALNTDENFDYFLGFLDDDQQMPSTNDLQEMIGLTVNALNRMSNNQGYFLAIYDDHLAEDHASDAFNVGSDLNNILRAINYLDTVLTRADDTLILVVSTQGSTLTLESGRLHEETIIGTTYSDTCDVEFSKIDYPYGSRSRVNATVRTANPEVTGGPDLPVFARGPGAQAFTGINDFAYLYHALVYATCLAPDASKIYQFCSSSATPAPFPTTKNPLQPNNNTTRNPNNFFSTTFRPPTKRPPYWPWVPQPLPHQSGNPYGTLGVPYYIENPQPNLSPNPYRNINVARNPDPVNPTRSPIPSPNANPGPINAVNANPGPVPSTNPSATRGPVPNPNQPATGSNSPQNPWSWASLFPFFI